MATATLATLELDYFRAVSLYRRRSYERCADLCNALLQAGHDGHVQLFATKEEEEVDQKQQTEYSRFGSNLQRIGPRPRGAAGGVADSGASIIMPTWLMEGVWQLKMRALTQRVYLDDLEDEVGNEGTEEVEFERIATAARPGSSIKTAFQPRPLTSQRAQQARSRGSGVAHSSDGRLNSSRPGSAAVARPGTSLSRPGSSLGSRCGTASRIRATSAAAFNVGDATSKLYQASRLNPTIYAERETLVKALFQFLYYHEADVQKAHSLCQAVLEVQRQKPSGSTASNSSWWWQQQMGRCLLALHYPRRAEPFLQQSLAIFPHPDTYLLLSRVYQRIKQPERALYVISEVVDERPFDVTYRLEQARIHQYMEQQEDALQLYRLVAKLQPINVESLASIAVGFFYDNNPEMALMYYRRILSLGAQSPELYCNIALCCLYGGQIDLVLPCFQRALAMATQPGQKADIWYNLSFVAVTSGDFNLARRCLQLCLTSDAQNGAALNNLAVLAAQAGDILGAKSYLNAAKDVMPEAAEVTTNLEFMDVHYKL
ncbi:tetratricopeptide repeat protein 8 [Drosophila eugracilis]|uniref:tetratricopeptide repeat protein 8 n=1 Tax=Drosophila eugracilis TaxID=29029 RepID=UPI001BD95969|nr:tetratricopeptide repeat protein 8 [Drosophila eugracilis]